MPEQNNGQYMTESQAREHIKVGAIVGAIIGAAAFEVIALASGAPLEINAGFAIAGACSCAIGGVALNYALGEHQARITNQSSTRNVS